MDNQSATPLVPPTPPATSSTASSATPLTIQQFLAYLYGDRIPLPIAVWAKYTEQAGITNIDDSVTEMDYSDLFEVFASTLPRYKAALHLSIEQMKHLNKERGSKLETAYTFAKYKRDKYEEIHLSNVRLATARYNDGAITEARCEEIIASSTAKVEKARASWFSDYRTAQMKIENEYDALLKQVYESTGRAFIATVILDMAIDEMGKDKS